MAGFFRGAQFIFYGYRNFGKSGFDQRADPDGLDGVRLDGRVALVTGGNAGLGFEVCKELSRRGALVHMVVRSAEKGEAACREITQEHGGKCQLHICDVSVPEDVRKLVAELGDGKLDALVLNAGVLLPDGAVELVAQTQVELALATNAVSNVQLCEACIPLLRKSDDPRVVFVSSGGAMTEPLCFTDESYKTDPYNGTTAYARTKRMQVALAHRYARLYPDIAFYSMHPGWADTPGVRSSIPGFYNRFKSQFRSSAEGADTIVWLVASPKLRDNASATYLHNGSFFRDRAIEREHFPLGWTEYTQNDEDAMYDWLKGKIGKV